MRYTRHELKQDKFAETAAGAMHWTVEHRSKLINGAIALAVIIVVVGGGWWYFNHREQQAREAFGQAMIIYNAPADRPASIPADPGSPSFTSVAERAKAAKAEFMKIADQYGSTRSGQYAKYFAAISDVDAGNMQEAEQALKDVAASRNDEIASLAKFALATNYRGTNREADAIKLLKEIIDHPTLSVPKTTAQLMLADVYEQKQPDEARKLYEQIAKEDPKSAAAELATSRRQEMNK